LPDLTDFIALIPRLVLLRLGGKFVPVSRRFLAVSTPELSFPPLHCPDMSGARMRPRKTEDEAMLSWVVTFLVIALIAGVLGFGGIAGVSIEIAKAIFFIAVVLFLITAVVGLARGRTRV
jgi:uncharacterized membrane protein YtjA (UPF0391 family)